PGSRGDSSAADRVALTCGVAETDLLRAEGGPDSQPRSDARAEIRRRDHRRCLAGRVRLQQDALDLHPALGGAAVALERGRFAGEALGGEDGERVVVSRDLLEQ